MKFLNVEHKRLNAVQFAPANIPNLPPPCRDCLKPAQISHCAACFGTHVPTGFSPQSYGSSPSISRDQICAAAKQIPEAGCIVESFCPKDSLPSAPIESPDPLAVVEQIIADLGENAVGGVDVQQGAAVTTAEGSGAGNSTDATTANTTGARGRAAGLCGKYYCT
ncbi:MAG: hypothetical protein Q9186_002035 [Xanthomendoza sp. 1 TL-2023]